MKKIFKYILLSALTITAVASCEDDRNNFLPEDSFGFNNKVNENTYVLPIYGGSYTMNVIKSGKGMNEGSVTISTAADSLLAAFNEANETFYSAVPADQDLYAFSTENISFATEDVTKSFDITWDVAKMAAFMDRNPGKDFCIPVAIKSESLEVNEGRGFFVLSLVTSTVTAEQTLLSRTYEWGAEPGSETADITVRIDRAIPTIDLTVDFVVDNELIAAYNEANGTDYVAAPEGLVTLGDDPVIEAGDGYALLPVTINTNAIAVDTDVEVDGVVQTRKLIKRDWNGYVVPVKLSGMSVDGVKVDNGLTYVVIKGLEPIPPQLFNRLWGIYATSSTAPWQSTFGISDARNITMDDEYIYIPQNAGGDPVLKAVSIFDPTQVKNVNVEGVSTGTHTLSCVRMIPNTDPELNGGKDLLVATNLTLGDGSHLNYYVWLDGIDNAPKKYMVEDSGRRMGDKFIVLGSWKNGEIYLKDFNTGNIIRNAMVETGIGEWPSATGLAYARGRFDYSASVLDAPNTIGSAYVYPGTANAGSGVPAGFLVSSTASAHYLSNTSGTVYASSADLGMALTHGYSFFSDAKTGSKYIAYVALAAKQDQASVKVISDFNGTPEGFMAVLQNQEVVFEAPMQDGMDATLLSPCPATHSTGDCVVREIGGKVYMAVMVQNVGISVFELNAGFKPGK